MISSKYKILLISTLKKELNVIRKVLISSDYSIIEANSFDIGMIRAIESNPDLIICQNEHNSLNAFQIYNRLKDVLIKNGTPFFIYSGEFDQEDLLIGLEMGIDNFIISPVDETALLHKIEHQLSKIKALKQGELKRFRSHFESTPVAKFIVKNNQIILANKAFYRLLNISEANCSLPAIDEIFNLAENKSNLVNYRKCLNGYIQQCNLYALPVVLHQSDINDYFDIHIYGDETDTVGKLYAEVMPSGIERLMDNARTHLNGKSKNLLTVTRNSNLNTDFDVNMLTPREKEIIELSSFGLPIKQIALKLNKSERTIEKHRANIMQKTGTNSIIEALFVINNNPSKSKKHVKIS